MTPTLERIAVHPVKSLDPEPRERVRIAERGALAGDREYAIVDSPAGESHDPERASVGGDGDYVNGKRTDAVHRLRSSFDPDERTLTLRLQGEDERRVFDLDDCAELNDWLSDYFDRPVSVRREPAGGYPDDREASGPTVVSTATLREVASWFPDVDLAGARRRFRASLEIGGVPAFWEDRLFGHPGEVVAFEVGDVRFEGVRPCSRCVVPARDPDTGEPTEGFRETFLEGREATLPEWADSGRLDHYYQLMVNTRVPESEWGEEIAVGDEVRVVGVRPEDSSEEAGASES
ncbi:MOSC N-terminal beta barrel domain-containing protein [Halorussus salilacus]|uniref:MOSC domain-containing protein n=1 Tax=Halorussus salilacus TaxID=2953750 RepID=UPI0020A052BA|nr:MOSC N-terminal beta barrel domain-containing protein [Halorussus salilacus]USZ67333.1 MOSC N-terminal beta barrel domain-containing protein [Halorussus salilacus]